MRIRFYPKAEAVRNVLVDRIKEAERGLAEDQEALRASENSPISIPGRADNIRMMVSAGEQEIAELKSQLTLLESHAPAEVMCEIEL